MHFRSSLLSVLSDILCGMESVPTCGGETSTTNRTRHPTLRSGSHDGRAAYARMALG